MSHPSFSTALHSSDHDFIAALRFLDDYGKQIYQRGQHHQSYHHFVPKFDLEQHADTYELYGELPGFRREDIIIEAHDDHSLQISGSISLSTQGSSPESIPAPASAKDKEHTNGAEPKPESQIDSIDTKSSAPQKPLTNGDIPKAAHASKSAEATTTNQERYLNARFGDVLDPKAVFVHDDDVVQDEEVIKVHYLLTERHPSSFHRAFHFPTPIRRDEVVARVQDGVLHVTAPRAPVVEAPRRVPIMNGDEEEEEVVYSTGFMF